MKKLLYASFFKIIYISVVLLYIPYLDVLGQTAPVFSLSPTTSVLKEGTTINLILSAKIRGDHGMPSSKDFRLTVSGSNLNHYSIPSKIIFSKGAKTVEIPITALNDNILFNNEQLLITVTDPSTLITYQSTLTIIDVTASNPANTVVTIGNSYINFKGTTEVTASFPPGISSKYPTIINLDRAISGPLIYANIPSVITIPASKNSVSFAVGASYMSGPPNQPSAQINIYGILNGSTSLTISPGHVIVTDDKLKLIPTVSPNGDAVNDCLNIAKITKYANNVVHIYDRWGTVLWESANYDNDNIKFCGYGNTSGWDNKLLIDGIYYYFIDFTDNNPKIDNPKPKKERVFGFFRLGL